MKFAFTCIFVSLLPLAIAGGYKGKGKKLVPIEDDFDQVLKEFGRENLYETNYFPPRQDYLELLGRAVEIARASYEGLELEAEATNIFDEINYLEVVVGKYTRDRYSWKYLFTNLNRILEAETPQKSLYLLVEDMYTSLHELVLDQKGEFRQAALNQRLSRRIRKHNAELSEHHKKLCEKCDELVDINRELREVFKDLNLCDATHIRHLLRRLRDIFSQQGLRFESLQVYFYLLTIVQGNERFLNTLCSVTVNESAVKMISSDKNYVIGGISRHFRAIFGPKVVELQLGRDWDQFEKEYRNSDIITSMNCSGEEKDTIASEAVRKVRTAARTELFNYLYEEMSQFYEKSQKELPIDKVIGRQNSVKKGANIPFLLLDSMATNTEHGDSNQDNFTRLGVEDETVTPETEQEAILEVAEIEEPEPFQPLIEEGNNLFEDPLMDEDYVAEETGICQNIRRGSYDYSDPEYFWHPVTMSKGKKRKQIVKKSYESVSISSKELDILCRIRGALPGGSNVSWIEFVTIVYALKGTIRKSQRHGSVHTIFIPTRDGHPFPIQVHKPHPSSRLERKTCYVARSVLFREYGIDLSKFQFAI